MMLQIRVARLVAGVAILAFATGSLSAALAGSGRPRPSRTGEAITEEEFTRRRLALVENHIARHVKDLAVLEAMRSVPRHLFVPEHLREQAYEDHPLPIGEGQTISQPFIVALMTELLAVGCESRVLEIGTGSGYQAAVLAEVAGEVYSIEIVEPLARRAARDLEAAGYSRVHLRIGDGYLGWPEAAPFDGIIVTCAPDHVPRPLEEQLVEGGRLVIPVGPLWNQELVVVEKLGGKLVRRDVIPVRFVPMTGPGVSGARSGK